MLLLLFSLWDKWIDKQKRSLQTWGLTAGREPQEALQHQWILFPDLCDWMDFGYRRAREARSDPALLESLARSMGLCLMAAVVSCLYTVVLNELDLWPLRLVDHPWINITAYIYDVSICLCAVIMWSWRFAGRSALLWRRAPNY